MTKRYVKRHFRALKTMYVYRALVNHAQTLISHTPPQVRSSLASGKSDDGESFWEEVINKVLFPLTSTTDTPQEKLVGIAAIGK